jgi:5S rRNA maturation endonuclease (ribonuclease M5)
LAAGASKEGVVVLLLDDDEAGQRATQRVVQQVKEEFKGRWIIGCMSKHHLRLLCVLFVFVVYYYQR